MYGAVFGKTAGTIFFEIISTPVWWYTSGIRWIALRLGRSAAGVWTQAGVGIWIRNLLVPMYGQNDIWGRIISFLIRLVNIIARSVWCGIWVLLLLAVFALWVMLPIITVMVFVYGLQNYVGY